MTIDQVKKVWETNLPRLENAFVQFPWEERNSYSRYLAQTYRYISESCNLLKYAAERASSDALKQCLLHHDSEEQGHEKLALNDLRNLGLQIHSFPELEITKSIYGKIYKEIDANGPAAIVGYALALEGVSARRCPEIALRLIGCYGRSASTLIKLHGDVDPDHIDESFEVLSLLTESELSTVARLMVESIDSYIDYLNVLKAEPTEIVQATQLQAHT